MKDTNREQRSVVNMPCHVDMGSDCCGIFTIIKEDSVFCNECGIFCNECGMSINDAIQQLKQSNKVRGSKMALSEVYERYKHLDKLLSDEKWLSPDIREIILYDLWQAIKENLKCS